MPIRLALMALLLAAPAAAQVREPIPKFAIDLHAATVGLPTAEGWIPVPVMGDTPLAGRGLGVAAGATVYPFKAGGMTFGFGAAMAYGRGTGEALTITTGSGANAVTRVTPVMHTDALNVLPQVSINFGHKLGWSYLSAGLGTTRINASMDAGPTTPAAVLPESWNQALNFGGGARWFMKEHLGASFDVRFVKLGARPATATLPAGLPTRSWSISAGISIQ